MKEMEKKKYPIGSEHYELLEEVGEGVSASVHRARCVPLNEIVAIKILDFERDNCDLNNISREVQTMVLVDHPNVLKSHCSFVSDHNLWVVMPYMAGGSCLHILKAAYPDGFEEMVIATILREVLKGLEYLHLHGHIHRDVKAGNILIDTRGAVKLGDFGVSACLFDSGDRQRTRNTFVGTPCWMAPEVMEQLHGYDFKADIWSFGITAVELAHGHAPFSKYPPMKVLLMTLQNAPPCLDYERDKKFTRSFRQMIARCLQKDPSKRPTARKLLDHAFFKKGRSNDYIARTLLEGLPDLGERMKALKRKEEDMLAQKKIPDGQMEELSQNEYKRGISSWNFNLDDLKAQASMIQDFDDPIFDDNPRGSSNSLFTLDAQDKQSPTPSRNASQIADVEDNDQMQNQSTSVLALDSTVNDSNDRSEKSDDYSSITGSIHELHFSQNSSPRLDDHVEHSLDEKTDLENVGRPVEFTAIPSFHKRGLSSSVLPDMTLPPIRGESQPQNISNCNATTIPLTGDDVLSVLPSKASKSSANSDDTDEKTEVPVVQQRGRFKVTSENVDLEKVGSSPVLQKSHSMQVITPQSAAQLPPALPSQSSSDAKSSNISLYSPYPGLQAALQMNIQQREIILNLMKQIAIHESTVDGACTPANIAPVDKFVIESAHDKDKEIIQDINELQGRLICTMDEQQRMKTENGQV